MINRLRLVICIIIFIGILIIPLMALAAPVGNPSTTTLLKGSQGVFSLKQHKEIYINTEIEADFLFGRQLKADSAADVKLPRGQWYMAGISVVFFDRVAPYIKLGTAHLQAKWTEVDGEVKLQSDTSKLAWGIGSKFLVWDFERPKVKIMSDWLYRMATLGVETGYYRGAKATLDNTKSKFVIREWQIALLAATEVDISSGPGGADDMLGITKIAPYAGIKYSGMNGRLRMTISDGNYHNPGKIEADDTFGVFVGCDLVGAGSTALSIEGRFLDETAVSGGLTISF